MISATGHWEGYFSNHQQFLNQPADYQFHGQDGDAEQDNNNNNDDYDDAFNYFDDDDVVVEGDDG